MKKYVKPMMISEAFKSNEYIAACVMISCNEKFNTHGQLLLKNVSEGSIWNEMKRLYPNDFYLSSTNSIPLFSGDLEGCDGITDITHNKTLLTPSATFEEGVLHHHLSSIPINDSNNELYNCGPNAS